MLTADTTNTGLRRAVVMKKDIQKGGALAAFLSKHIDRLAPRKSQREIAAEVGFKSPNFLSMIKRGEGKLPLDKVPLMAKALDVDPVFLLRLTLDEYMGGHVLAAFDTMFNTIVSRNEAQILEAIRAVNPNDPRITAEQMEQLQAIFK